MIVFGIVGTCAGALFSVVSQNIGDTFILRFATVGIAGFLFIIMGILAKIKEN